MIQVQKFHVFVTPGHRWNGVEAAGSGDGYPQTNQRKYWRIQSFWMDLFLNILEKMEDVLTILAIGTQWLRALWCCGKILLYERLFTDIIVLDSIL